MELTSRARDVLGNVMNGYLNDAKQASWATLWYQPSKLEPELVRLVGVLGNPGTLKELQGEQAAIAQQMKAWPETANLSIFLDLIPTSEFHLRYQTQEGYELLREWNGDKPDLPKQLNRWGWIRKMPRFANILLPVGIALMLYFIVRLMGQQGI
jgi:hypothetical protein